MEDKKLRENDCDERGNNPLRLMTEADFLKMGDTGTQFLLDFLWSA